MNQWARILGGSILALALAVPFVGCESGGDDNGAPEDTEKSGGSGSDNNGAPTVNLVGFWEGTDAEGYNFAMNIKAQNGNKVSGQWASTRGTPAVLDGTVSGKTFTYTATWPTGSTVGGQTGKDQTVGTANVEGKTMTATATPTIHSGTFIRISDPRP
ncbi:MAG: hypothetical protein K8T26_17765 [Lentisphaerae bacterium]|nr:hypothetical protein [Lentisphaerota bacterium]